ncbi:hypothetical protein [Methanococcoides alaskense]|uniref:Uncharacterized protein n=1 Tax=Methanococcoides alaskense TaxID=325778 RepID=A0AA90ZDN0_9EURY|nr:hypothetical protein [Methanococcoides alaskense]MDA0524219.1 hypothetical protein [Methanococcoides alaskense]MDR6223658.1 hypothetical protein [Methanococcoides alaskense]
MDIKSDYLIERTAKPEVLNLIDDVANIFDDVVEDILKYKHKITLIENATDLQDSERNEIIEVYNDFIDECYSILDRCDQLIFYLDQSVTYEIMPCSDLEDGDDIGTNQIIKKGEFDE